jgi:transcriptional regulator with XRE-family HTH domain
MLRRMELRVKFVTGERVREARERRLLTQEEAAAQIGVAPRTLQNWEAGAVTPRVKHQRAILAWLEEAA